MNWTKSADTSRSTVLRSIRMWYRLSMALFRKVIAVVFVAEYAMQQTQRTDIQGDCDPLDICVLTERTISHGDIIARVRPIGGFRMLDGNEADDKIIAVLKHDATYNVYNDISELPHMSSTV